MEKLDSKLLRDVSSAEIESELGADTLISIDNFQTIINDTQNQNPISRIIGNRLFPAEAINEHGKEKLLGLLACNISMYDDQTEDLIDADPLVSAIFEMKLTDPNNTELYTRALRVRRSVIAVLHNQTIINLNLETQTQHTPQSAA